MTRQLKWPLTVAIGLLIFCTAQANAAIITSGLVLRYQASDYNSTTGAWTNSGSAVGSNATAVSPLPTLVTASNLNNQQAVQFAYTSASPAFTATYSPTLFATHQMTAFVVFATGPGTSYETLWSSGRGDTFTSFGGSGTGYSGLFRSNRVDGSPASGMPVASSTGGFILETDSSDSSFIRMLNGVTKSTNAAATTFLAPGTLHIGGNDTPNSNFQGRIAQVLIYNRLLTYQEETEVNYTLGQQYAVPIPEPTALASFALIALALCRKPR